MANGYQLIPRNGLDVGGLGRDEAKAFVGVEPFDRAGHLDGT